MKSDRAAGTAFAAAGGDWWTRPPAALAAMALVLCVRGLAAPPPAAGVLCTLDNVPAATLLLPYFEVNLDDPNGQTTLFSVANASAAAVLAHAVLWTDLGAPTLAFDIYLTGFDVQSINLRDVFAYGQLPRTADAANDPGDTTSPKGPLSQGAAFPDCKGLLPPPPLTGPFLAYLRAAHTGAPLPQGNGCVGASHGDHVARGYHAHLPATFARNAAPARLTFVAGSPGVNPRRLAPS